MMNNPYLKMIEAVKRIGAEGAEPFFYVGRVVEDRPEATIEFGGIQSRESDFSRSEMIGTLRKGDEVLILAEQAEQRFFLLCRVVSA